MYFLLLQEILFWKDFKVSYPASYLLQTTDDWKHQIPKWNNKIRLHVTFARGSQKQTIIQEAQENVILTLCLWNGESIYINIHQPKIYFLKNTEEWYFWNDFLFVSSTVQDSNHLNFYFWRDRTNPSLNWSLKKSLVFFSHQALDRIDSIL